MMKTISGNTAWFHVVTPKPEDMMALEKEFSLEQGVLEELRSPSARQKVEEYEGLIFAILKFPIYEQRKKTCRPAEMDVIITEKACATITYEKLDPVEDLLKQCESLDGLRNKVTGATSAQLLKAVLSDLFTYGMRELTHIDRNIAGVTDQVYAGKEKEMIRNISLIKRDVLDFRRILRPTEGILKELRELYVKKWGIRNRSAFEDALGAYHDVFDVIENQKDTIESLETTNQALLASKIGEVSKILALAAFLLMPFTIIGTLFQINTQFTPLIGIPGDWWIVLALIAFGCFTLYVYFRKRRWF